MDNAIGLGIILSLQDRASAGLESIRNKLTVLRDVSQDMMKRFDEGAKQMLAGIGSMVTGAKVLGIFNRTFGVSIDTAADFEQAMARVGAVSGAVGEDFARLTKQARDLGRDTQYSATQAANSQELLARAGFKTNEIISAMPNLLYMAGAEGMDMARAADIAAGTLRGFGLEAAEMSRVANVLAKTSSSTNTSIDTLGESFKYVAPDAKVLKVSIEEVSAIIGAMGDANIKASQAGTYLRAAFNNLVSPTKDAKEALNKLGMTLTDKSGELKSFDTLMQEFSERMQGMTGLQKKSIFGDIFDKRSSTGMLSVLTAFETGKLSRTINELSNVGEAAKEMYDRMSATAQGATKRLESATEGLRIAIGNHLLPAYTWTIDKMAEFKSWLTQLIEAHPVITKAIIGLTTAIIGLSGSALILVGALASIGGFIKMWPLMKSAAMVALSGIKVQAGMALASLSHMIVPIVAMIALAGALYYAWRKNLWGIRDMVTAVTEGFKMALSASTDGIAEVDEELANKLKAAGIWDFAVTMGKVFFRLRQFWNGFVQGFQEGLDYLKEGLNWLKDLFAPAVESGQELLKFLGIFELVANSQVSTWQAWGQLIGGIAPVVLTVIAAFKGFAIVAGIVKAITGAFALLNAVMLMNPAMAIAAVMIAAAVLIYTYWDEISEWFSENLNLNLNGYLEGIKSAVGSAIDLVFNLLNAIKSLFTLDFSGLWDSLKASFDSYTGIYASLAEAIASLFNIDASNIIEGWKSVWSGIGDILAGIFTFDFSTISEGLMKYCEGVKTTFLGLGEAIVGLFGRTFSGLWDNLVSGFATATDWIKKKWKAVSNWWNSWKITDVFAPIMNFARRVADWVKNKWQKFSDWWNSWTLADIFAPIVDWASSVKNRVVNKFQELFDWWDSWTFGDIFAGIWNSAVEITKKIKQPFIDFKNWLLDLFANINPFNWFASDNQVKNSNVALAGWTPPEIPAMTAPIVNVPAELLTPSPLKPQSVSVTPVWAKGNEEIYARMGISHDVLKVDVSDAIAKLTKASVLVPTPRDQAQSSPYLIQHSQNQAVMNGQANVQALGDAPEKPVNVNNNIKIEGKPGDVYLDGEKVGSFNMRWIERQNIRNGMGEQ